MMAALATALSAQSEETPPVQSESAHSNVYVYVSPAAGGTAEEREYFDFNLQEEVKGSGYALADSETNSDFFIDVELSYDREYDEHIITLILYRTETGEILVTSGMVYETLDEMYDWNLTLIYRVMANAPISKSLENKVVTVTAPGSGWNTDQDYWLKIGLRGGPALRLYYPMTSTYTSSVSFDAGLQVMGQILPFLGIQAEVLFTMDSAPTWGIKNNNLTSLEYESRSYSLSIPLVVKGTFRYKRFLIAPFAGAYFTMPWGNMTETEKNVESLDEAGNPIPVFDGDGNVVGNKIESKEIKSEWGYTVPLGLTGGIVFGLRLGPGTLFLDTRYSYDLGDTRVKRSRDVPTIDDNGVAGIRTETNFESIYRRSGVSFTLGYEFNLFKKKPKK